MLLRQDILAGKVDESMKPKKIYEMRPEYKPYIYERFQSNYKNLLESIKKDQAKADSDSAALAHDFRLRPPVAYTSKGYPRWDGSNAQRFLKEDFNAGKVEKFTTMELRQSRPEYQDFPLKVFRDHIHQERRSRTETPYWMNRKKMAKK
jgi:hypothetical protein